LDLDVGPGQIVGIAGENGSGKSTLLKVLAGRLGAAAGQVRCSGRVGYCPQEAQVLDGLTVRENLRYFAAAYGLVGWARAADAWMQDLGYAAWADSLVSVVSGGTRQKLNLTVALLHEPELLLLDEPYAGFDWETYLHFWELAGRLRSQGRAIVVVSHLIYDRARLDRVLDLHEGRLVEAG
jgi:ABC-type multidrug transport system ATPase subunit